MEVALMIARLCLALIFVVAGITKAADLAGSRRAVMGFGVPERVAGLLGLGLPFVEILIAVALVPLNTAWWGAVGALALLLIFTGGIALNLMRGRSPECRCFGQLHSEPVSWSMFGRNLALSAAAAFVVLEGRDNAGSSALNWLSDMRTSEVANLIIGVSAIALFTAATILLTRILKQQANLQSGIGAIRAALDEDGEPALVSHNEAIPPQEGLPIGAPAPKFSLATITGEELSLDDLLEGGKFVVLLFSGPDCFGCKVLLPAVRVWQQELGDLITVAALSTGTLEQTKAKMAGFEISNLLLDRSSKITNAYQAKWTPAAVLIGPDGKIASFLKFGHEPIRTWLRDLTSSGDLQPSGSIGKGAQGRIPQVALSYSVRMIGEPAPKFRLIDLSGKTFDVDELRGRSALLLFWHPHCENCKTLFDDLRAWEEQPPADAPRVIFIASGEINDIRAFNKNFKSTTLLDPAFDVGPLFGATHTPTAILIDGEGRIASSSAIGVENVRALVGLPKAELVAI